jgi:hypothetical protein
MRRGLQVEHRPANLVKGTRLVRRHGGHRGTTCAFNALDQTARGGI